MLSLVRQSLKVTRRSSLLRSCQFVPGTLTDRGAVFLPPSHSLHLLLVKNTRINRLIQRPSSTSAKDTSPPSVLHSDTDLEFTITFPSHSPSYLKYRYMTPSSINMYTTVVPTSLEGRGVAKLLANAAFDWAVDNQLELQLSCWYLAGYLKRNPREDVLKLVLN